MSSAISPLQMRVMPSLEQMGQTEQMMPNISGATGGIMTDASQPKPESFSDLFSNFVSGVNEQHHAAADAQAALMNGEDIEVHDVMIQMEQASLSTDLLLEMRNRLVAAVNDLTRMPM